MPRVWHHASPASPTWRVHAFRWHDGVMAAAGDRGVRRSGAAAALLALASDRVHGRRHRGTHASPAADPAAPSRRPAPPHRRRSHRTPARSGSRWPATCTSRASWPPGCGIRPPHSHRRPPPSLQRTSRSSTWRPRWDRRQSRTRQAVHLLSRSRGVRGAGGGRRRRRHDGQQPRARLRPGPPPDHVPRGGRRDGRHPPLSVIGVGRDADEAFKPALVHSPRPPRRHARRVRRRPGADRRPDGPLGSSRRAAAASPTPRTRPQLLEAVRRTRRCAPRRGGGLPALGHPGPQVPEPRPALTGRSPGAMRGPTSWQARTPTPSRATAASATATWPTGSATSRGTPPVTPPRRAQGVLRLTVRPRAGGPRPACVVCAAASAPRIGADGLPAPAGPADAADFPSRPRVAQGVLRGSSAERSPRREPRQDDPAHPPELDRRHDGRHVARHRGSTAYGVEHKTGTGHAGTDERPVVAAALVRIGHKGHTQAPRYREESPLHRITVAGQAESARSPRAQT